MKKYDKVNLASDIYRDRKSPINQKNQTQTLYSKNAQSACCPNCRYLFKININQDRSRTPDKAIPTPDNKSKISTKTISVQTEQNLMGIIRTSPKKQKIQRLQKREDIDLRKHMNTDRTPIKSKNFDLDNNPKFGKQIATDRKYVDKPWDEDYERGQRLLTKRSNQSIANLKKSSYSPKLQYPARSAYTQQQKFDDKGKTHPRVETKGKDQSQKRDRLTTENNEKQRQKKSSYVISGKEAVREIDQKIKEDIGRQLIKKIMQSEQINEIINYQMNIPAQMSIPAYCKMLGYHLRQDKTNSIEQSQRVFLLEGENPQKNGLTKEFQRTQLSKY